MNVSPVTSPRLSTVRVISTAILGMVFAASAAAAAPPAQGTSSLSKMPDSYLEMAGKDIYFWAWPMTNLYNRRLAFKDLPHAGLMGGTVPVGPSNQLS